MGAGFHLWGLEEKQYAAAIGRELKVEEFKSLEVQQFKVNG
jgi:hypothetical protein